MGEASGQILEAFSTNLFSFREMKNGEKWAQGRDGEIGEEFGVLHF